MRQEHGTSTPGMNDADSTTVPQKYHRASDALERLLDSDSETIRVAAARTLVQLMGVTLAPDVTITLGGGQLGPLPMVPPAGLDQLLADIQAEDAGAGDDADQLRQMVRYLRSVDPSDTRPGEAPIDMLTRIVEFYRGSGNQRFEDED